MHQTRKKKKTKREKERGDKERGGKAKKDRQKKDKRRKKGRGEEKVEEDRKNVLYTSKSQNKSKGPLEPPEIEAHLSPPPSAAASPPQ